MLKQKYFLTGIFILSAERQPIKLSWRKIVWLRMDGITTYPFNIFGCGWEKVTPTIEQLPFKGDTVIGNDVWIGQNVTIMPGVIIGDGAIIAANSTVVKSVEPYSIYSGNPAKFIKKRFSDEKIEFLLKLEWWNWSGEEIFDNLEILTSEAGLEELMNLNSATL